MLKSLENVDVNYIQLATFDELKTLATAIQEEVQEAGLRQELLNILANEEKKDSNIIKLDNQVIH